MFAEQFDVFLLDLDGVVYLGDQPLSGAVQALQRLRDMGKILRFLTNDPRPTREQLAERLKAMGIVIQKKELITSGWTTATFLRQEGIRSAYIVGSPGLHSELREAGIQIEAQEMPEVVVIGCDEDVSYQHIWQAVRFLEQGARFIATNADGCFPTPTGPAPATGAIVEAIRAASGKHPLIIGKPFPVMFTNALQGLSADLRVVMLGDSPTTDILGAHQAGINAILISSKAFCFPSSRDFRAPDATIPDLSSLFDHQFTARVWERHPFSWPEHVEAGVAAVAFDGTGSVLLVKRGDNGLWGLPSGHVEPGETVEEAIMREVLEETGLYVRVIQLIGVYSDPASQVFSYPTGQTVHFITSCFRCEVIGGQLHPDGREVLDVVFADVNKLPEPLLPMHPRWLSDALARQTLAFIR